MIKIFSYIFRDIINSGAINAARIIGNNDKNKIDEAAVLAIQSYMENVEAFKFFIVSGEGDMDCAPLLRYGSQIGNGDYNIDVAIDPVDCTGSASISANGSISTAVFAEHGTMQHMPDTYMNKIVTHYKVKDLNIDDSFEDNLKKISKVANKRIEDIRVCMLKRDRNNEYISKAIELGAKIKLIQDGDVMGCIESFLDNSAFDFYYGSGGSPEGLICSSVVKNLNGSMSCKLIINDDEELKRANNCGISNINTVYSANDLIRCDSIFIASGITKGDFFEPVKDFSVSSLMIDDLKICTSRIKYNAEAISNK